MSKIRVNVGYILKNKYSIFIWYVNLCFISVNFLINLKTNYERIYISQMYDYSKLLLISEWSVTGFFYLIVFPILVVIPTHELIIRDNKSGMNNYIIIRERNVKYIIHKIIAVHISTFILFTVPLLIEWFMSALCLDLTAKGDPSNDCYYIQYNDNLNILFGNMFNNNRPLYILIRFLIFGMICGSIAVLNLSVVTFLNFQYGLFAIFPIYILIIIINSTSSMFNRKYSFNINKVIQMFNTDSLSIGNLILLVMVMTGISFVLLLWRLRKK